MSSIHTNSYSDLLPPSIKSEPYDDSALEGVATNIKLVLKLIEDHKDASTKEKKDSRRTLRVAEMMTILDMVRARIQKCQSFGNKSEASLRRCNTELRASHAPSDKRPSDQPVVDEKEGLRKELNASLAARRSLEMMCSSLGKEKEIMAGELARKAQEASEMEEEINGLRAQNETLSEKIKENAAEQRERKYGGERNAQANTALQGRNKALSEQLLRSLDGYRSMKRKYKEAQEENLVMREKVEELGVKIGASLEQIRGFKQRSFTESGQLIDIKEILELEQFFEHFKMEVSKHRS